MKELYKIINTETNEKKNGIKKANIFLTREQYTELIKIKNKYQISFGTIAKLILECYKVLKPLEKFIKTERLYKTNWKKTSIKINCFGKEELDNAKVINNTLIVYLDKLDQKILKNEKMYQKLRNEIANMFQNTEDPFYDYNIFIRKFAYARKQVEKI